jgi:putative transposase
MRRIDDLHLDYPFAGSRMLRDLLRGEGIEIGRERVTTSPSMVPQILEIRVGT